MADKGARQLVLPVDGSEATQHTVHWMLEHIFQEGDVVHLLHVVADVASDAEERIMWFSFLDGPVATLGTSLQEAVQTGLDIVNKNVTPLLDTRGVTYQVHILTQSTSPAAIARTIAAKAVDLSAHCVVMAHHPRSAVAMWLLGSVSVELSSQDIQTPLIFVR